jgi:Ser/Thr protein kinase RdoA (MazF antagonist)
MDNTNLVVVTDSGTVVVRRYEITPPEEIAFELEIVERLRARSFPVAALHRDRSGACQSDLGGRPAAIFDLVGGEHPDPFGPGIPFKAGTWLAGFHKALVGFEPSARKAFDDLTWLSWYDSKADVMRDLGYDRYLREVAWFREAKADLIDNLSELPRGVVHSDLHAANVLVRGEELTAFLDLDTAYMGALARDLAETCQLWGRVSGEPTADIARMQLVANGYESVRPLNSLEARLLPDLWLLVCVADATRYLTGHIHHGDPAQSDMDCKMFRLYLDLKAKLA